MQSSQLRTRATNALRDAATDTGRLLLFLVILSVAFLASILLAVFMYGAVFVGGGTNPIMTAFGAGGRRAVQILGSFTGPESNFYIMSLYSALFMGAASYWLYQKTIANLGRLRRWA